MKVAILLASGDDECLVLAPDGKIFNRNEEGEQTLALDPAGIQVAGEEPKPFDYDTFAKHAGRWGMYRVVGADGQFYPHFDGHGLPKLELSKLEGEPVYRLVA